MADDPHLVLMAEYAQGGRVQGEVPAAVRGQPEPARGEDAQDVSVSEERDVAGDLDRAGDDAVGGRAHLLCRLAAARRRGPEVPARGLAAYLGSGSPLVRTVVPLHQVRLGSSERRVAREAAGLSGAGERAREDERELPPCKAAPQHVRLLLTASRERDVRPPGVLPREAPGRLAVSDEVDLGHAAPM